MDDNKFVVLAAILFIALVMFFYLKLTLTSMLFITASFGIAVKAKSFMPAFFTIALIMIFTPFFSDLFILSMLLFAVYLFGASFVKKKDLDV